MPVLDAEIALIEAILYLESEPVEVAAISRITGLTREAAEAAVQALAARCAKADSGVDVVRISDGVILSPKKEYWDALKERYGQKNDGKLSRAAMETLSIIAYSQPVTRAEIEAVRGASPDNMIRQLLDRGLIREAGKKDIPGKPVQYGTTKEFLRFFRLESIAALPRLDDNEAERFELSAEE
jgi:segregation and condensation protein B